MKLKIHILILTLFCFFNLTAQEKYEITWNYRGLVFRDFVTKVESFYPVTFFYKEEWVKDLKLGDYSGSVMLSEILDNLFTGSSIHYFIAKAGNVILTKDFVVKVTDEPVAEEQNFIPPTEYPDDQRNRQQAGNISVDIGNRADKNNPGNVTVSGYIINRDTKESVSGVTVFIQMLLSGTISNENGYYTITLPRGNHLLQFSYIGMKEKMININLYSAGELNVEMNSMLVPLKETVVSAQRNMMLQRFEVGVEKVIIPSFRLMPTTMGESDIILNVLMIPAIMPGSYLPSGDSSLVIPDVVRKEKAIEGALYIDDKFTLIDKLSVNIGMRISSFFSYGQSEVFIYNPLYSKSNSTITDTLKFRPNEISKIYAGPEFRMSLNYPLTGKSSIKINYNRTRQYLHLLSNSTSVAPTDTWKLSDYYLKPQVGDQFALGIYKMFFRNSLETSAELYYKQIKNMVDYKGGTSLIMNKYIEEDVVNVIGKAYGLELLVKKTDGRVRWSVGYTYARTFIKSISHLSEEIINSGKWFPANFDKPNDLVLTLNYLISRRLSFSSNYTWSTGRPITYPESIYQMDDIVLVHYSERNKYRIPDYYRLDVSLRFSGNLKSHRIAHPNWTFSVYNLLGRQNVYSIYFKNEGNVIKGYKMSVFGRAIPSVTFSFDF
jgi:CarboxypepD_reg-like domain